MANSDKSSLKDSRKQGAKDAAGGRRGRARGPSATSSFWRRLAPITLSDDQAEALERAAGSEGLRWQTQALEGLCAVDARKGSEVQVKLQELLAKPEWSNAGKVAQPVTPWNQQAFGRMVEAMRKSLGEAADKMKGRAAPGGYQPRGAGRARAVAVLCCGQVLGFLLAHVGAVQCPSTEEQSRNRAIIGQIVQRLHEEEDESVFRLLVQGELEKDSTLGGACPLMQSMLGPNATPASPLGSSELFCWGNAMLAAGIASGVESAYSEGFKIVQGKGSARAAKSAADDEVSDVEEEEEEADEASAAKRSEKVSDKISKQDAKAASPPPPQTKNNSSSRKRSLAAEEGEKQLPATPTSAPFRPQLSVELRVPLLLKTCMHIDLSAENDRGGFLKYFPHSLEFYPADESGRPVMFEEPAMLPTEAGYTRKNLRWWGVRDCEFNSLQENDSTDEEEQPPPLS